MWAINIGKQFVMFQNTPHAEHMRGALKHRKLFANDFAPHFSFDFRSQSYNLLLATVWQLYKLKIFAVLATA